MPILPFPQFFALRRHRQTDAVGYVLGVLPEQLERARAHDTAKSNKMIDLDCTAAANDAGVTVRMIDHFGIWHLPNALQCEGRDTQLSMIALLKRTQSKRISERERAFAGRQVDIDELQKRLTRFGISGLVRIPPKLSNTKELWRLKFEREHDEKTPFGMLKFVLDTLSEWELIYYR